MSRPTTRHAILVPRGVYGGTLAFVSIGLSSSGDFSPFEPGPRPTPRRPTRLRRRPSEDTLAGAILESLDTPTRGSSTVTSLVLWTRITVAPVHMPEVPGLPRTDHPAAGALYGHSQPGGRVSRCDSSRRTQEGGGGVCACFTPRLSRRAFPRARRCRPPRRSGCFQRGRC